MMLILSLIISLILTLVIELIVSAILGIKDKYDIKIIIIANFITNPLVVYIANCLILLNNTSIYIIAIALLEILAIIIEFLIYKKCLKFNEKSPLVISTINNIVSFSLGLIITKFII